MQQKDKILAKQIDLLFNRVANHIEKARLTIYRTVDSEMVKAYWLIGKDIVENEQEGSAKAKYGKQILKQLSEKLNMKFGAGFSVDTLERARKFYLMYKLEQDQKSAAAQRKSQPPDFKENLGWTHYRLLMKVSDQRARMFYEVEANKNSWSSRELNRQIGSLLFERLAKSKDKQGLMQLVNKGQEILSPSDAIKDPMILEFLGLPETHLMVESKLEEALITNLQQFLLELGKGFAFVARQKRISLDGDHFYADLVFYHVVLKCYVILDLKTHPLTHGDLGQMQFYVNYFDNEIKADNDNPTIGLVLCTSKKDTMVKYTLGDKAKHIFASKYQFHMPTEEELKAEINKELKEIKHRLEESE